MKLKSSNPANHSMIKSIAKSFCDVKYVESVEFNVFFEHEQFWLRVTSDDFEDTYSVEDSECDICKGFTKCFNCGSDHGIGFELIERIEF